MVDPEDPSWYARFRCEESFESRAPVSDLDRCPPFIKDDEGPDDSLPIRPCSISAEPGPTVDPKVVLGIRPRPVPRNPAFDPLVISCCPFEPL